MRASKVRISGRFPFCIAIPLGLSSSGLAALALEDRTTSTRETQNAQLQNVRFAVLIASPFGAVGRLGTARAFPGDVCAGLPVILSAPLEAHGMEESGAILGGRCPTLGSSRANGIRAGKFAMASRVKFGELVKDSSRRAQFESGKLYVAASASKLYALDGNCVWKPALFGRARRSESCFHRRAGMAREHTSISGLSGDSSGPGPVGCKGRQSPAPWAYGGKSWLAIQWLFERRCVDDGLVIMDYLLHGTNAAGEHFLTTQRTSRQLRGGFNWVRHRWQTCSVGCIAAQGCW